VPLAGVRRIIAERISHSYRSAPHVPITMAVDMTAATELRGQLLPEIEARAGVRLTYTDLIAAATVLALRRHRRINATLEEDGTLVTHSGVHLGIAVALEDGLIVPVVRDAHTLALPALAAEIRRVAERARAGQLGPAEVAGGTFTISNLGAFGVDQFDPIINPPQVAILGVSRIAAAAAVVGESVHVRQMMNLTLCFDHRPLDGAPAARFLAELRALLEAPGRILLGE
jgi:pyruvate dehydrogenase E2 component (dihydrolipoamide acetyltransferase)